MKRTLAIILGLGIPLAQVWEPVCLAAPVRELRQAEQSDATQQPNQPAEPAQAQKQKQPSSEAPDKSSQNSSAPSQVPQQAAPPEQPPSAPAEKPETKLATSNPDQGDATQTGVTCQEPQGAATPPVKPSSRKKSPPRRSAHRKPKTPSKVTTDGQTPNDQAQSKTESPDDAQPPKRVVREGGTAEPKDQLSPAMSDEQASHARQNTGQLLASTDANLKKAAGRDLNESQQAMLAQIRKFMEQANEAVAAGDFQRGHNLAMKAHMLSADLVKH
jgi:hypothetical protein